MAVTLADSLEVVLPDVPTALVPTEARPHIVALARNLAPYLPLGIRGSSPGTVLRGRLPAGDLGPRGRPGNAGDPHLSRSTGHGPAWDRLDDFVAEWDDPASPLHGGVDNDLWLEFDRPPAASLSVFAGFPRWPGPAADRARVAGLGALHLLAGGDGWSQWRASLERCFAACPPEAYVSHVGLMIGRPSPVLRMNIKQLEPDQLGGVPPADRMGRGSRSARGARA